MTLCIHDTHHNNTTIMLNVIMLRVGMLSVIMLSVVMLSAVMLSVVVPPSDLFRDNTTLLLMTF